MIDKIVSLMPNKRNCFLRGSYFWGFDLFHPLPNLVKVTQGHNRSSNRNPERALCQNRAVCDRFGCRGARVETEFREFLVRFRIVSEECIFILSPQIELCQITANNTKTEQMQ